MSSILGGSRVIYSGDRTGDEKPNYILTGNAIFMESSYFRTEEIVKSFNTQRMMIYARGIQWNPVVSEKYICCRTVLSKGFFFFNFCLITVNSAKIQTMDKRVQDNRRNIIYFPNKNTIPARTHVNKLKTKTTNSWSSRRATTSKITREILIIFMLLKNHWLFLKNKILINN